MGHVSPFETFMLQEFFNVIKKLLNPMGYDRYNCSLKIWESIGIPTPKVGAQLGV
jgi:hypothetical protein